MSGVVVNDFSSSRTNVFACLFLAFAALGYFKVILAQDYLRGKFWANVALEMLKNSRPISATVQVNFTVNAYIMTWFVPMRESSRKLFETYRLGMKVGDFTMSMYALGLSLRYSLLEGTNLSLISRSLKENLKKMVSSALDSIMTFAKSSF